MRAEYIKSLMFHTFEPEVISRYTGWQLGDSIDKKWVPETKFGEWDDSVKENLPKGFYESDLALVKFGFKIIKHFSVETLKLKYEAIKKMPVNEKPLALPDIMSDADSIAWAREPSWSDFEAVLLSVGVTPGPLISYDFQNKEFLFALTSFKLEEDIDNRLKLIQSHQQEHGSMGGNKVEIIHWFRRLKFSFPVGLENMVYDIERGDNTETVQSFRSSNFQIEKSTLLKLVAGMAIRGYKFDPKAKRSVVTAEIQQDLDLLGISLDQKTILKWLREATSLIAPENLE